VTVFQLRGIFMTNKPTCAVLVPIYKNQFSQDEVFSVQTSLSNLQGYDVYWVAPDGIDLSFYKNNFRSIKAQFFNSNYFVSISGYNKLLTSAFFYEKFIDYDFCLICQPDAIVLKPDLKHWLDEPYDYIGAPWPNGYCLTIKTKKIPIPEGVVCTAFVGNGGLSLRRNKACINLINEFDDVAEMWRTCGHAEDLFFSIVSNLSEKFMVPSIKKAALFSHDIEPEYLYRLNNFQMPMGVHAWSKYNRGHWMEIFSKIGGL
jgi:hypothetical protein